MFVCRNSEVFKMEKTILRSAWFITFSFIAWKVGYMSSRYFDLVYESGVTRSISDDLFVVILGFGSAAGLVILAFYIPLALLFGIRKSSDSLESVRLMVPFSFCIVSSTDVTFLFTWVCVTVALIIFLHPWGVYAFNATEKYFAQKENKEVSSEEQCC